MDGSSKIAAGSGKLADPLSRALAGCPTPTIGTTGTDELWMAVRGVFCTRRRRVVTAAGSRRPIEVSVEHATAELLAAMGWLVENEHQARAMSPVELRRALAHVACRGPRGSARVALADALHGLTGVPARVGGLRRPGRKGGLMSSEPFGAWAIRQLGSSPRILRSGRVLVAFDLLTARLDLASAKGAAPPMRTLTSHTAGGNSRVATRTMLRQLHPPAGRPAHLAAASGGVGVGMARSDDPSMRAAWISTWPRSAMPAVSCGSSPPR